MNFLERVLSNYFLAWSQIFNYKDKTRRIPFWHFFILDGFIGAVVSILSNNNLANDPNDFYNIAEGYDWSYFYSIPSFLVFIALLTLFFASFINISSFLFFIIFNVIYYVIYVKYYIKYYSIYGCIYNSRFIGFYRIN